MTANYQGDNSFNPRQSAIDTITITKAATGVTVTAVQSSGQSGGNFTLSAVVNTQSSGVAPAGTVQFLNGGTPIGGAVSYQGIAGSTSAVASLQATLNTVFSATAIVTAQYSGDANYVNSTSTPITITSTPTVPTINSVSPSWGRWKHSRLYFGRRFPEWSHGHDRYRSYHQRSGGELIIDYCHDRSRHDGVVSVEVTNPGAQPLTLSSAYTYRVLAPASVPSNAMRIPYVVDTYSSGLTWGSTIRIPRQLVSAFPIWRVTGCWQVR